MPAMTGSTPSAKISAHSDLFDVQTLFVADAAERVENAKALASLSKNEGVELFGAIGLCPALVQALNDKKSAVNREAACAVVSTLCESGAGQMLECYVIDSTEGTVFPTLLETFADKVASVATAATAAVKAIIECMNPWAVPVVLPSLLHQIKTAGKWQVKTGCLTIINQLVITAPDQTGKAMPTIVPFLADAVWDTKLDVKKAAKATLTKTTALVSNKDIAKFIPALIKALLNPVEEVPKTIQLLSATTFVSEVDAPTLSLLAPLLSRGLDERPTATKRKVAVITDNMAKLVDNEYTVRPFIPKMLPGLIKISETVADPEARGVVMRAIKTLREVAKIPEGDGSNLPPLKIAEGPALATNLIAGFAHHHAGYIPNQDNAALAYAGVLAAGLVNAHNYDQGTWESTLPPYLTLAAPQFKNHGIVTDLLQKKADEEGQDERVFDDEEAGEDLCNCTFSLAYGAKILLNTATLRLKRGHRYGLCGRNGSGKSTLMNAIVNGQVEGFPDSSVVRTFYVQHDIDGSEAEISVVDWVLADKRLLATPDEIRATLADVGFDDVKQKHPIGSLSGGWKMKLALARAILFKADILLLDEPTNHLDVLNVTWLIDYLTSLTNCTSIIVSHDSDFLNRTVTDIIGYVAQHAFHHIDHHLDKTPLDYMLWRYQTGEDLEELQKANRQLTEEEEKKMKEGANILVEGVKRIIDELVGRKKSKQSYMYEVSLKGLSSTENQWFERDELISRGFEKKVLELDTREAQRLGMMRPLVRKEIEKHFEDFGLESEFTSHNTMRGLSGGQKVKVVLGAATWRRPHIICLDEPTNYLDRESLAALIEALKAFEGGVLIITHNREFSESICSEVWAMRDGRLEASGQDWTEGQGNGARIDQKAGEEEDVFDAMGNKVEQVKKVAKKSAAELRKAKKDRMLRRKRGEEVFTDEEL